LAFNKPTSQGHTVSTSSIKSDYHSIFFTQLGWMGVHVSTNGVRRLVFGYSSAKAVAQVLQIGQRPRNAHCKLLRHVQILLKDYAAGLPVDFSDVPVDPGPMTTFRRRVMLACRSIPYGETRSYGELAAKAGSPRAARAVGNCMAGNPVPLIVPCHRVVRIGNDPGPFSAPGGTRMKVRLLRLESGGETSQSAGIGLD
jgi:methylated-DNA-[protein]-cysteine S-methyltransferase